MSAIERFAVFTRRSSLQRFVKNPTLPRGFDLIFESVDSLPLKLNQFHPVKSNFIKLCKEDLPIKIFKFIEGIFDIYCRSKDMVPFLKSQRKLEPTTLNQFCFIYISDYSLKMSELF